MLALVLIWIAILIAGIALSTFALRWGGRVAHAQKATAGRALMIVILVHVVGLVIMAVMPPVRPPASLAGAIVREVGVFLFASWIAIMLIRRIMVAPFGRAALALLFLYGAQLLLIALILGLVRPFVTEAYSVPTNSMAPTIIGYHAKVQCPACQAADAMIVSAPPVVSAHLSELVRGPMPGACTKCGQRRMEIELPKQPNIAPCDRILVNKLVSPKRWDVVAFRTVEPPEAIYVKRLVGMPGETVFIKDGSIFVNGAKLDPPSSVSLRYTVPQYGFKFGSEDRPFKLGPDEYAMLGDFSEIAVDSRYWGPLPGKNLIGKVECRYWPPSRCGKVQ